MAVSKTIDVFPLTPAPAYTYPLEESHRTTVTEMESGKTESNNLWRFSKKTFRLLYKYITDAERDILHNFYRNQRGSWKEFWLVDFKLRHWIDEFVGYGGPFDLDAVLLETHGASLEDETGSTYNRGDFTSTNAFFWSDIDLSAFAGTDTGNTPYYIVLTDGAGKQASGYIGAVGGGETLGGELSGDTGFDNDGYWAKDPGWSVAASVATAAAIGNEFIIVKSNYATHVLNALYKTQLVALTVTGGQFGYLFNDVSRLDAARQFSTNGTKIQYFGCSDTLGLEGIAGYGGGSSGTFENISSKRVTDCPVTAVHIISSRNGTIRAWEYKETGFNPNTITSWDVYLAIPTFTDYTDEASDSDVNDVYPLAVAPAVNDAAYYGAEKKFDKLTIDIGTAGNWVGTLAWEYWNGTAWTTLAGIADGTATYEAAPGNHDVTYTMPADWAIYEVEGLYLYWVRSRVASYVSITTRPKLDQVWYNTKIYDLPSKTTTGGSYTVYVDGVAKTAGGVHYTFVSGGGAALGDRITFIGYQTQGDLITADFEGYHVGRSRFGSDNYKDELDNPDFYSGIELEVREV
jgi:hypothetical protein